MFASVHRRRLGMSPSPVARVLVMAELAMFRMSVCLARLLGLLLGP